MTLRHIKIFIKVYQMLNITKAAETLYMTQPAVSRAIKEIEFYYGIKLFDRINHRLHPTSVADMFYEYVLHISDSFDQMEKSFKDIDQKGIIKIGATITIGNYILPKILKLIKKKYPKIEIIAKISNADNIEREVINGKIDFAVIEGEIFNSQFIKKKIGEDSLSLVVPNSFIYKNMNIKFEQLKDYPLLVREKGSIGRDLVDSIFKLHKMDEHIIMESESTQAIINSVHEGVGISFLPYSMIKKHLDNGYISTCNITNIELKRNNYVIWHKHKFLTKTVKEIIELFN